MMWSLYHHFAASISVNPCSTMQRHTEMAAKEFDVRQLNLLSPEQKITLAKELHYKYNATIQQLRRILRFRSPVRKNAHFTDASPIWT